MSIFTQKSFTTYYTGEDMPPQIFDCANILRQAFLNHVPSDIKCWVAGGAIRAYFENKPPADLDVFFPSARDYDAFVAWLSAQVATQTHTDTYHDKWDFGGIELDLVHNKYFDTPEDTLMSFDYTICAAAVARDHIVFHDDYFLHLGSRALVPMNVDKSPFEALWRLQKFAGYGYEISRDDLRWLTQKLIDDGIHGSDKVADADGDISPPALASGKSKRNWLSKVIGHGLKKDQEPALSDRRLDNDIYSWGYGS